MNSSSAASVQAAVTAYEHGWTPLGIRGGQKNPVGQNWTRQEWTSADAVRSSFEQYARQGATNVGLLLGEPSRGLVDIDLDHPSAWQLRDYFLPTTAMVHGRPGMAQSHYWYVVTGEVPGTRRYKMPDGEVSVELRSTGGQTVIPPSTHPTGEQYRWEHQPWGGDDGPARVDGGVLAVQVALLALGAILLDAWPAKGGRHDAYLALAGGLLRTGDKVHPWWEKNLPVLIDGLAQASHDDDADSRVREVMRTTLERLRKDDGKAVGFPRLAELIGNDHTEAARRMAGTVEELAIPASKRAEMVAGGTTYRDEAVSSTLPPEQRDPLAERTSTWTAVDLEPYLTGEVVIPEPGLLYRSDGQGLFYPGLVNTIYGLSESAKSWVMLGGCLQHIGRGERVLYVDLEDTPAGIVDRLNRLGAGHDDLETQFRYVRPEEPLAPMQHNRFGNRETEDARANHSVFTDLLTSFDPTLVVVDGMNELFGLHGHDTNDAAGTTVVTSWLKSLCRGGRAGVVVIDHTNKSGAGGPGGAHHKLAVVQGTALRVDVLDRPMPGARGHMRLVVYKDRPGAVRAASSDTDEQVAAEVYLDSTQDGKTFLLLEPYDPDVAVTPDTTEYLERLEREKAAREAKAAAREAQAEERRKRAVKAATDKANEERDAVLGLFGGDLDLVLATKDARERIGWTKGVWSRVVGALEADHVVVTEGSTQDKTVRLHDPARDPS